MGLDFDRDNNTFKGDSIANIRIEVSSVQQFLNKYKDNYYLIFKNKDVKSGMPVIIDIGKDKAEYIISSFNLKPKRKKAKHMDREYIEYK